jgi:Domain of unknown function (DUF4190)
MSDSNQPPPPPPWSNGASDQPSYNPAVSQGAPPPPPPVAYGLPGQQSVPYGYPGAAQYPQGFGQPRNDGLAIASLVCSLTGLFTCGVTSILAVIFGFVSRSRIKKSNGSIVGSGMALAGIIIGFALIALYVLYFVVILATRRN